MAHSIDPVIKSYLDFLIAQQKERWARRVMYRLYATGENPTQMTDDQKILLVGADAAGNPNSDPEFNINISSIILASESDRLSVRSIPITVPDDPELSEAISKEVWSWWEQSGMGEGQQHSYFSAARDGDGYPIVDFDEFPRITVNMAYDGESGTEMAYEDAHPTKPLYAAKRWTVERPVVGNAKTNRVFRMNLYFDNRIEYYISRGMDAGSKESGWRPLNENDRDFVDAMQFVALTDPYDREYMATVAWLTVGGTENGAPIGNPVKHMRHDSQGGPYGRSRIADVAPGIADATNRAGISVQTAQLLDGFKEILISGFFPTRNSEGVSNALRRSPGAFHYFSDKDIGVTQTTETDLLQLIAVLDKWIILAATLTSTPLSLFNLTAHTPAEGTQKQLESALVTSVEQSQRAYTTTWQAVVIEQIKFDTLFNDDSTIPIELYDMIDDFDVDIIWEEAETRNEKEEREIAVIDHTQLGVPKEFIWQQFYSPEQIAKMLTMSSELQGKVLGQMGQLVADIEAQNAAALAAGEVITNADNGTDRERATASAATGTNGAGS